MVMNKFNIITYIKPNHNFEMFSTSLTNVQKSKHLNKLIISFVEKLPSEYVEELNKYENITWKDEVNNYWAQEIKEMIYNNPSNYYYLWEEDSHIFDIKGLDNSFQKMIEEDISCLITQDLKWIKRAKHLLDNNLAIKDKDFMFFNWGTHYAKYCRETSNDTLVNGAYPVTISSIFSKELLLSLINDFISSTHWEEITKGNFSHFHNNPKLPHSFEVYPGFWWEGKNNGYGNIEYSTMVSTIQFAEELGGRLINKINKTNG